jgi:hypothetical protein
MRLSKQHMLSGAFFICLMIPLFFATFTLTSIINENHQNKMENTFNPSLIFNSEECLYVISEYSIKILCAVILAGLWNNTKIIKVGGI